MNLENFDAERFLRDHWQKRPAFIKDPWTAWRNPIAPDELAGLACEDGIESRLISENRNGSAISDWTLEEGPFDAARFARLGKSHWTLLVQAVDQYVPQVSALITPFRFIPDWRIDDVMISYAVDQGSVGPHYDQYDVFLIQGMGRRKWQVGKLCDDDSELIVHDGLRQLAQFEAEQEWICEPGDIVYIPPGYAHHGVALADAEGEAKDEGCMTYSIGFRAPSRSELIAHFCDHLLDALDDDDRYADPDLQLQDNPGEIKPAAIDMLHAMVTEKMRDRAAFARWFGQQNTQPKYGDMDITPDTAYTVETVRQYVADSKPFTRNPASRFSFIQHDESTLSLFNDGHIHDCQGDIMDMAKQLCGASVTMVDPALAQSDNAVRLLTQLLNRGSLLADAG